MRAPEFWRRGGLAPALLAPLAWGFDAAGRVRRAAVKPRRAPVPVVCVGNLVAGGAGKTPVALSLGARLAQLGRRVHFLAHGYGGSARGPLRVDTARHTANEVGDEALLLAAVAPTWVARDRPAGALAAAKAGAEVVVMDDGFQNPALAKDLTLVVVDGGYGFGNGRVMPAGPLREDPGRGLGRCDAVVLVGEDSRGMTPELAASGAVLLHAAIEPAPGARRLAGKPLVAFAGIGHPAKVFATLDEMGCRLLDCHAFPDHHRYSADEIMTLVEKASAMGAVLVTTEKDFVRLPEEARPMVEVLGVRLSWADEEALDRVLAPLLAPA